MTTIPAARRRRRPPARRRLPIHGWHPSRLARREALWGFLFISPWLIGFFVFTLAPMIASLGFTFTNVSLAQEEPLAFVGLHNWQTHAGRRADLGVPGRHLPVRPAPAADRDDPPAVARDCAQRPGPQGAGRLPRPVLPALRDPVRVGRPHLAGDAQPRDGLAERLPALHRHREPAQLAQRLRPSSTRRSCSSASGASGRRSSSTWPACAGSRPSSTTPPTSTAPGGGARCAT